MPTNPIYEEILKRFGTAPEELGQTVYAHWMRYREAGFTVKGNIPANAHSAAEDIFNQWYWEVALGNLLLDQGLSVSRCSATQGGPDFRVEHSEQVIWIEATAPTRGSGPDALTDWRSWFSTSEQAPETLQYRVPEAEAFLLRYPGALRNKQMSLAKYRENGIISPSDAYVIAINVSNLGPIGLREGSEFGMLLRSLLPIGSRFVTFNIDTGEPASSGRHFQDSLIKKTGEFPKPFLGSDYTHVSAVIGSSIKPTISYRRDRLSAAVHNPRAINAIPIGVLPVDVEFQIIERNGEYDLLAHEHSPADVDRKFIGYEQIPERPTSVAVAQCKKASRT